VQWAPQHLDLLVQPFEDLAQAFTHQGMIIDNEDFQEFHPGDFLQ